MQSRESALSAPQNIVAVIFDFDDTLTDERVMSIHSPKYNKSDDLGAFLRLIVNQICVDLDVQSGMAL